MADMDGLECGSLAGKALCGKRGIQSRLDPNLTKAMECQAALTGRDRSDPRPSLRPCSLRPPAAMLAGLALGSLNETQPWDRIDASRGKHHKLDALNLAPNSGYSCLALQQHCLGPRTRAHGPNGKTALVC